MSTAPVSRPTTTKLAKEKREKFYAWRLKKQEEEQKISDTVSYFVTENPITTGGPRGCPGPVPRHRKVEVNGRRMRFSPAHERRLTVCSETPVPHSSARFSDLFISVGENPELILEQNIRDMNDQVPRMNESIAMVKANVTLLAKGRGPSYKSRPGNDIGFQGEGRHPGQPRRSRRQPSPFGSNSFRGALARTQGQLADRSMRRLRQGPGRQEGLHEWRRSARPSEAIERHPRVPPGAVAEKGGRHHGDSLKWPASAQTHDEMVHKIEEHDRHERGPHGNGARQRGPAENARSKKRPNSSGPTNSSSSSKRKWGSFCPRSLRPVPRPQKTIGRNRSAEELSVAELQIKPWP